MAYCSTFGEFRDQLMLACESGDLVKVQALCQLRPTDISRRNVADAAIQEAARAGELDIIRFFVENCRAMNIPLDITHDDAMVARQAAKHGRLAILQYLVEEAPNAGQATIDVTVVKNWMLHAAHNFRQQEVLWYLLDWCPQAEKVRAFALSDPETAEAVQRHSQPEQAAVRRIVAEWRAEHQRRLYQEKQQLLEQLRLSTLALQTNSEASVQLQTRASELAKQLSAIPVCSEAATVGVATSLDALLSLQQSTVTVAEQTKRYKKL